METKRTITLIGAGPVGSLLSLFLSRRGYDVEIYERRPDMRVHKIDGGRSINLALSTRGLFALEQVELRDLVLARAIPMKGRMMHSRNGELSFQQYGRNDSECIHSVSRGELNKILMSAAEGTGKVKIHFQKKVTGIESGGKNIFVEDEMTKEKKTLPYDVLIGTDGSASAIRGDLVRKSHVDLNEVPLDYGYKEFRIPQGPGGEFLMEKNALHIWPRGAYMLIALPNEDGSFTATLFLPHKGHLSFESLKSISDIQNLFEQNFKDVLKIMPQLVEDFFKNPVGHMTTVKCFPWTGAAHVHKDVLLAGDAAHAIVPFFGQGMNCGFEDCTVFDGILNRNFESWNTLFEEFQTLRKKNCDAIADLAVENFTEMRDKVGNPKFLLQKEVELRLQKMFPMQYVSRYAMVTFSQVPYEEALKVGVRQNQILEKLCESAKTIEDIDWEKAVKLVKEQ